MIRTSVEITKRNGILYLTRDEITFYDLQLWINEIGHITPSMDLLFQKTIVIPVMSKIN